MDKDFLKQVQIMFAGLNRQRAHSFPAPGTLSNLLSTSVGASLTDITVPVPQKLFCCFATAAVEMWQRSLHSFLISASLTKASPIWASVSGYYASHYAIRAFAHLFGVFHLHRRKRIVRLDKENRRFVCRIERKRGRDGEHKFYWKCVSEHPQLAGDPLFYLNLEDQSDGAHRNKANYSDHVNQFPTFQPLNARSLGERLERISNIELSDVPVPKAEHFPDLESVQIVAYHRLLKFRRILDEAVGLENRFWKVHRTPSWYPDMKFEVVEPTYISVYAR